MSECAPALMRSDRMSAPEKQTPLDKFSRYSLRKLKDEATAFIQKSIQK